MLLCPRMNELAVAIILVVTAFLFSLEIRRRRLAETRLQETLASVEQQVADRTEALERTLRELTISQQRAEEASHLKDEFLATASHELRTPLNSIVGWVHVLRAGALANDEQRRQAITAIDRNARIQTRLIEDLLDVSRMSKGQVKLAAPSAVDLRAIVVAALDTIRPAASAKEVAVEIEGADATLPVLGDEQRLHQVIWNLLTNALKYSSRGGRITVSAGEREDHAVVSVRDNGDGIDPGFLPHVFEPFRQGASSTTMRAGLGLGLAIVKELVELHGGRITAESAGPGRGSTFSVSLPLARRARFRDRPDRLRAS